MTATVRRCLPQRRGAHHFVLVIGHRRRVDLELVGLRDVRMSLLSLAGRRWSRARAMSAGSTRGCLCVGRAGCSAREGLERPGIGGLA